MFGRWYALFIGFLLLVLGLAGLVAASQLAGTQGGLLTISIVWLLTAVVALWVGFAAKSYSTTRWFAGIVGGLYFLWGIIQLFAAPAAAAVSVAATFASIAGFVLLLGALGLAAAFVPATWLHEERAEPMAA
jgi:uncharacterized membrane protein